MGVGHTGNGWGALTGRIYLDANHNGICDPGEAGVAGVTVLLDGRFSTQTDADGTYHFEEVATGDHALLVPPDALPLPWHFATTRETTFLTDGLYRTAVSIEVRHSTTRDIGIVR